MSLTLAGDVGLSLFLTTYGDRLGRKNVLLIGAGLMTLSGLVFFHESNYYLLLLAAICGVISPSGAEVGPFRAIEESTLAQLTTLEARADVFAWYTLLGSLGAALGALVGGWTVQIAQEKYHFTKLEAYKTVFLTYAAIGFIKFIASCFLSRKVEAPAEETEPLLANDQENATEERAELRNNIKKRGGLRNLLPNISPSPRRSLLLCVFCLPSTQWVLPLRTSPGSPTTFNESLTFLPDTLVPSSSSQVSWVLWPPLLDLVSLDVSVLF